MDTNVTAKKGDPVYWCRVAQILSRNTGADENLVGEDDSFVSSLQAPVFAELVAVGDNLLSITGEVQN